MNINTNTSCPSTLTVYEAMRLHIERLQIVSNDFEEQGCLKANREGANYHIAYAHAYGGRQALVEECKRIIPQIYAQRFEDIYSNQQIKPLTQTIACIDESALDGKAASALALGGIAVAEIPTPVKGLGLLALGAGLIWAGAQGNITSQTTAVPLPEVTVSEFGRDIPRDLPHYDQCELVVTQLESIVSRVIAFKTTLDPRNKDHIERVMSLALEYVNWLKTFSQLNCEQYVDLKNRYDAAVKGYGRFGKGK